MVRNVMLIRHAQSTSNLEKFFAGHNDVGLTTLGRRQAALLEKRLDDEKFDAIFCSDLKRCRETLKLSGVRGDVVYTPELREKNYGDLEGTPWSGHKEYYRYHIDPFLKSPNGESASDVLQRVVKYFNEKIDRLDFENVLVVSHHGPITLLACHLLGMPIEEWRGLRMGNAGISIFEKGEGRFRLTLWNSVSYLGLRTSVPLFGQEEV
jgi:alpha-ribazole phosphatase